MDIRWKVLKKFYLFIFPFFIGLTICTFETATDKGWNKLMGFTKRANWKPLNYSNHILYAVFSFFKGSKPYLPYSGVWVENYRQNKRKNCCSTRWNELIQIWWSERGPSPGLSARHRLGSDALTEWAVSC